MYQYQPADIPRQLERTIHPPRKMFPKLVLTPKVGCSTPATSTVEKFAHSIRTFVRIVQRLLEVLWIVPCDQT